jgi:hypothetical protein
MTSRYEARAAAAAARRDEETRRSVVISRLRLAAFLPGAAALVWALTRGGPPWLLVVGLALLAGFAALVVWHARVDERVAWFDAVHVVNRHGLARLDRDWDRLPRADPHAGLDLEHHPYANDLDLFGRASLMQWLGPAATSAGARALQAWLLAPAPPAEVRIRHEAVAALAPAADWREGLGAHGRLIAGVRAGELTQFLRWAEAPGAFTAAGLRTLRVVVVALTAAIWILMGMHATGGTEGAFWLLPLLAGMVLSYATAGRLHADFERAGSGEHAFGRYADLFRHAADAPGGAAALDAIRARLTASGHSAPACLRQLSRILGFAQLRSSAGIFHFVIQAVTLWDFHVYFALDRWRHRVGPHVREWLDSLGELDALSTFAQVRQDHQTWCLPRVDGKEPAFRGTGLGHPLIPDGRRVANDVEVGPSGTLLLITGSNMSGKSTLLRAIGLNAVLAQAGAPVCASSLAMPPVDLETSIRVQDSLEQGLSYFMAALARLKGVVDRARAHQPYEGRLVMYLLDEILQGTNTAERSIAVRGIARHLLAAGAIGAMTTHDLGLAEEEPLSTAATLAHFTETVGPDGSMSFDYQLRPGLATSRNALRLMRLIGLQLDDPDGTSGGPSEGGPLS